MVPFLFLPLLFFVLPSLFFLASEWLALSTRWDNVAAKSSWIQYFWTALILFQILREELNVSVSRNNLIWSSEELWSFCIRLLLWSLGPPGLAIARRRHNPTFLTTLLQGMFSTHHSCPYGSVKTSIGNNKMRHYIWDLPIMFLWEKMADQTCLFFLFKGKAPELKQTEWKVGRTSKLL